jgi:hypothetical protein
MPTSPIAARLATLPMTSAERSEAVAYVAAGERLAGLILAISKWLEASPALKPSYQD